MRVETAAEEVGGAWTLGLVGYHSERYRRVRLTPEQLLKLHIDARTPAYDGDGHLVRLGLQAYALGIAYEFDPYFGLSISRVDPLPHQLEAVYDHLLKLPVVRFLLADDAGAGKTIMAGLLLRELKLRGLVERVLVVCPANLAFQWQREMNEKFDEKFVVLRGSELRTQFGVNPWRDQHQVITSLDLAKREDVLPGLRQTRWDLVVVDEAHRMSAASEDRKSQRYQLGELLRDTTDHFLMLTATPHKGDPDNFSLFLRLLDRDAFAHVKSIREAMKNRQAPFYLRRTKEAMVYFPTRDSSGTWVQRKIFTRRIPATVRFDIDGPEFDLYRDVTRFVKNSSARAAAAAEGDPRARAIGFLMALFQRRLASSTAALRASLERRSDLLAKRLHQAMDMNAEGPVDVPDAAELDEMEEEARERLERRLEALVLTQDRERIDWEIEELRGLAERAQEVIDAGAEAKLGRLKRLLEEQGFFQDRQQRLLVFTEFKDTLDYLVENFRKWGFQVGFIHGGMKPGARDEPGTRLFMEQQFKDGDIQILVATEAAGEGINLQVCHIMVNYDIPWNPNRLEQRMGRIHRYGQEKDCLIFNFVAGNTIEGRVLDMLLTRLQEIRDALEDDQVFNVVGEVVPAAHLERIFRDYYAGRLGDADLEEKVLEPAGEERFRQLCQSALEGLASKKLNLAMLVERRAKAQERRVVPETLARFVEEAAAQVNLGLKRVASLPHTFDPGPTPAELKRFETLSSWRLPRLAARYPRLTTDRAVAQKEHHEWVTPGHSLFEALRLAALEQSRPHLPKGACYYSVAHATPARLDFYRARVVDGMGRTAHERLVALEISEGGDPQVRDPSVLGDLLPAPAPAEVPKVALLPEALPFLYEGPLQAFLDEVQSERHGEVERVAKHVELALTELMAKEDEKLGRLAEERDRGQEGAAGQLAIAEGRFADLDQRRRLRRTELGRQRELTLQGVERIATALVLPHPERERPDIRKLRPDPVVEAAAVTAALEHERTAGRIPVDVSEKNLGYDVSSFDPTSGELRLIEVKGLSAAGGDVMLTPNEHRVAQDRRDCYWLYVVTGCGSAGQQLHAVKDPASKAWAAVQKIQHFTLGTGALFSR